MDTEEYFPRGGKKPTSTHFKQSANFLGTIEKTDKKKTKLKKKSDEDDGYLSDEIVQPDEDKSYRTCGLCLSYKIIKEDFLVLGRISEVKETKLLVSLPSRLIGTVMACHISESYNKQLEAYVNDQIDKVKELPTMFKKGQYVSLKILEVSDRQIMLSMMPQHVNSMRRPADLHKGALLQAAVSSEEDHGFMMDVGIPNTTAFLPKDAVDSELELDIGMITWCSVKSVETSPDKSVVKLTSNMAVLQKSFQRTSSDVIPCGTAVDFIVDKPLDNGIEGRIFGDRVAYIQRPHIDTSKGKKPALGQKIRVRVLYCMPPGNIPYASMRDVFDPAVTSALERAYNDGDIVEDAQVIKVLGKSVYFRLGGRSTAAKGKRSKKTAPESAGGPTCTGVLSVRRVQMHDDFTDEQMLAKSYPIGSTHRVRILGYHLLDKVYSITDQSNLLNEKYFSMSQLTIGEVVTATITEVTDKHLRATVGRVQAFVPQAHVSDSGIYMDPKKATVSKLTRKKYKVGQEVTGRILSLDEGRHSVVLTLKPSLLAPDLEVLASYESARVGAQYTGVIGVIRDYILVSFFNNVTAFVPRNFISKEPLDNLALAFHIGQIVSCVIINVDVESKKMVGSLTTAPFIPDGRKKINKNKEKVAENNADLEMENNDSKDVVESKKSKRKHDSTSETELPQETDIKPKKKKKSKHKDEDKGEDETATVRQETEDSDAIEADFKEPQLLSVRELRMVDLTNCNTEYELKDRVRFFLKRIEKRIKEYDVIDEKIKEIENNGLNTLNKKIHTELYIEKLQLQERITKIMETLKTAQEKLKQVLAEKGEFVERKAKKNKKEGKKAEQKEAEQKDENLERMKDIKVIGNMEPAIAVPSAKDFWAADEDVATKKEESSSSDDEDLERPKKKRKKLSTAEKVAKAREEEERVREMERRAIESEKEPRSVEQFQRALLASPDCSQLWIAYMAFHLQSTEIDRARGVARRALSTISFREESEKLNVWLALLNLEHRFGTKETQQKTLEEALQMNERYQVHAKLLDILVETGNQQELVQLVELMMRKYRGQLAAYLACGAACYSAGLLEKARQVMQKGVAALDKKERKLTAGQPERSEALFEQVLAAYPARVDASFG
ncbi:unnamed protein product [Leptidea sinapis]|uniref:S1 motif domain-containing protein n=1 Tax=Leptidea sinapis TaxID=189913 RepID=A0A5E4R4E9_9NEOP|nr:unnamed protein product [Leptidea sinapis]